MEEGVDSNKRGVLFPKRLFSRRDPLSNGSLTPMTKTARIFEKNRAPPEKSLSSPF